MSGFLNDRFLEDVPPVTVTQRRKSARVTRRYAQRHSLPPAVLADLLLALGLS